MRHDIETMDGTGDLVCTCEFRLRSGVWSSAVARRIAFAHLAKPTASTSELLMFVRGSVGHGAAVETADGPGVLVW